MLVCATLILGGIGFRSAVGTLNLYLKKEAVPIRDHFDNISRSFDGWRAVGADEKFAAETIEALGTDTYLSRDYEQDSETTGDESTSPERAERLNLHVAYYTGMIDTVPHVPDRCLLAAGFNARSLPRNVLLDIDRSAWKTDAGEVNAATGLPYEKTTFRDPVTGRGVTVRLPVTEDGFRLRTIEFSHPDLSDGRIYGGYFFIANGRIAVTPEDVKLFAFRRSERSAYYCKVQFFAYGSEAYGENEFIAQVSSLLEGLLPELMRCLPDWSEVEAADAAAKNGVI